MKRSTLVMLTGVLISVITLSAISRNSAYADNSTSISWLKDNAKLWVEGKISDGQYLQGISLFVQNRFLSSWMPQENSTIVKPSQNMTQSSLPYQKSKNCNDQNFPLVDWHGCDHSNAYLSHADLNNANLQGVNLSHANLLKAYLTEAHLNNANLNYAEMTNIDLPESDLSGASLVGVDAPFVDFRYANMTDANFTDGNFHDSTFSWANLKGAIFRNANLYHTELLQT